MAEPHLRYPSGIQTFEKIREGNYVYVDKTSLVHELVGNTMPMFLSRPRRFGKSLLLSTIEAYFLGRRDLFRGLAIDSLTERWEPHPVFHIDLSGRAYIEKDSLRQHLNMYLEKWEALYGDEKKSRAIDERFAYVIARASEITGRNVVVLVDEYDKPLLDTLDPDREEIHRHYKDVLRGFYGCLKSADRHLRFVMLTGVTKFSQVSIFSGLNNLNDISMSRAYSTICGITPDELERDLAPGISCLADEYGVTAEEMKAMLREKYDGYHFASDLSDVYNPFSLMLAFDHRQLGNYWFQSGNPKFLISKIKSDGIDLSRLQKSFGTGTQLQDIDLASSNPVPLLFQSGYLTIKGCDRRFDRYFLDYPNREVKEGFLSSLVPEYTPARSGAGVFDVARFVEDVENGDVMSFLRRLESLFAGFPYDQIRDCELHYHNVVYLTFTLMGFYVRSEYRTSDGRCDAVVMTDRFIYLFEFKYDGSAEQALRQIDEKRYDLPFASDSRQVIRIGVNFSSRTRRIDGTLVAGL